MLKKEAKKFPESPGVYLFKNQNGRVIYVGRAGSLKKRVASYFSARADARTKELVAEAARLSFQKTETLLEAVVCEAKLIKRHWPRFNVREKDDRSFVYLIIPKKGDFPRPFVARGREVEKYKPENAEIFGPYQSYHLLKSVLSLIRKVFPFSACSPSASRPCFQYQLGLCPGVCAGKADKKEYGKNIGNLILFFKGEKRALLKKLKKENPEKIKALAHVRDVALLSESRPALFGSAFRRVEGYDVSHFFGKNPVGAMVVFTDGKKDSPQYRLFNIRAGGGKNFNDLAMLEEVLERRLKHREWPRPDAVLVDGGLNQVKIAKRALARNNLAVPVVGLAKSGGHSAAAGISDRLVVAAPKKTTRELLALSKEFFQAVRNEAHRFALASGRKRNGAALAPPVAPASLPCYPENNQNPRFRSRFRFRLSPMPSPCEQIKAEYEDLKSLKREFDSAFAKALETGDLARAKELKAELEQKRDALQEKLVPREIKGTWENPQTGEKKEIVLNIGEQIKSSREFYKNNLNLEINEREFKRIWAKNRKEIQKEMETYGYDYVLLIPENLPDSETLNEKLIETMEEPRKGRVVKTVQGDNFTEGGGFSGAKTTKKPKNRIILTKNVQNTYHSNDPIIEATLNKNIMQLTGLIQREVEERIKKQESLSIDFKTEINNKEISIQAEGLSLEEYLIFQRKYFEENQRHLDENGWTWLLESSSGARVVDSGWGPVSRRLDVFAGDSGYSIAALGCRPSRSFSI